MIRTLNILALAFYSQSLFAAKPDIPVVMVEIAKKTKIFDEVSYPARVLSSVNATVLSETEGVVKNIAAPLGQEVKRGQVILRLQHTDPVFKYAPVAIRSPVDGVVSNIAVSQGAYVSKGASLATVTDPKKVFLRIEVAAADLNSVRQGTKGSFSVAGGQSSKLSATVKGVSPFVDPATGTATAELAIVSKKHSLRPGMVGNILFKTNQHEGIKITEDAVVYRGKKTFVRTVKNEKARLVPVKLGKTQKGIVEILEGLEPNNTVVVRSSQFIAEGDKVVVEKSEKKVN